MLEKTSVIAMFDQHVQAEAAVKQLQHDGFDMTTLSIVGKGYDTEENVVGYYTAGDRVKHWGAHGAFWGGVGGLLFGSAFFVIPGIGPVFAAGPIVAWVVAALEAAAVVGGASALGAGLYSIGIPEDSVLRYETLLRAGRFMLVVHGTAEEVARAQAILSTSDASVTELHSSDTPMAASV
jgi:hypothetical protein